MRSPIRIVPWLGLSVTSLLVITACSDDTGGSGTTSTSGSETETTATTDSDSMGTETGGSAGDGDGDPAGDGDGDTAGDGDGDTAGDGDGDTAGDGDGDTAGDGDGDTAGDGDGDTAGDGDGDSGLCGDAMVTDNEVCDDGINDGSYGGCNEDCLSLAPYCGDAVVNGPEPCDDANLEIDDGCYDTCEIPTSCLELHTYDDMAPDGVYLIAPEGYMGEPFTATCDMVNGGWTLALRFAPSASEFQFYSPHWTQESLVNELELDPEDPSDGKFWAYDFVPGTEIRGCLQNPMDQEFGCKAYEFAGPSTLLELFTTVEIGSDANMLGLYFMEDDQTKLDWLTIQGRTLNEASVAPNYVEVGLNLDDDQSCYDAKVRFGLVLNNENSISTLNDAAGFGAQSYYTPGCDLEGQDSEWRTAAGFAAGPNIYETAGQIWVR